MKYLLLFTTTLFSLPSLEASLINLSPNVEYQLSLEEEIFQEKSGRDSNFVFASFVSKQNQPFGTPACIEADPSPKSLKNNIYFERKLVDEGIEISHDNTVFGIKKDGHYKIDYGITLLEGEGVFSLHKKGKVIKGTQIEIVETNTMISQSVILYLKKGDKITLSLDTLNTLGSVLVGATFPNGNSAYIDFVKID